jgi:hypothetical protein
MDAGLPLCKPFFDLPYETRHIIYENIECDALPPLSTGKEYTGFILSCKQAKEDMELIATWRLQAFLKKLKPLYEARTKGYRRRKKYPLGIPDIPKNSTFTQLRCITVTLPYFACSGTRDWPHDDDDYGIEDPITNLQPLFARYFDTVHIHLQGNSIPCDIKGYPSVILHQEMIGLADQIAFANKGVKDTGYGIGLEADQLDGGKDGPRDSTVYNSQQADNARKAFGRIHTKRICFSWDSGDFGSSPLTGKAVRLVNESEHFEKGVSLHRRGYHHYYYMQAHDHGVGEMGIWSDTRWAADGRRVPYCYIPTSLGVVGRLCMSSGFGEELLHSYAT